LKATRKRLSIHADLSAFFSIDCSFGKQLIPIMAPFLVAPNPRLGRAITLETVVIGAGIKSMIPSWLIQINELKRF